ncbi:GNAT family N-acetyltransferase, partial [Streptomyces cavourensis]
PRRQGEGIGAGLIRAELDRCDRDGVPAYLEASSARSRTLYERLGFHFLGTAVDLPDGPRMWPMWRDPQAN